MRAGVFLDRDDTLIRNRTLPPPEPRAASWRPGDLCWPERVELLPGVFEACRLLRGAGFVLVVITNQGLVARGTGTEDDVRATNARLCELLSEPGEDASMIADVLYCPYHPEGTVEPYAREHPWRKPAPGMVLEGAARHGLDLSRSWLVGDAPRDVEAGLAAGIAPERALLVGEGRPLADLAAAAGLILGTLRRC